jgi:hypothetical protein
MVHIRGVLSKTDQYCYILREKMHLLMTLRDDVWDSVLPLIRESGRCKAGDLPFDKSQRHTVRRVLKEMEEKGWLTRPSERSHTWYAGDKAKKYLTLTKQAEVLSDPDFEV